MKEIIEIVLSGFWEFIGALILLSITFNFVFNIYNRTMRCLNIKRHGWPPTHVDADGDFKKEEKETNHETNNESKHDLHYVP